MQFEIVMSGNKKRIIFTCAHCGREAGRYLYNHLHRVKEENKTICIECRLKRDRYAIVERKRNSLQQTSHSC